MIEIRLAGTYEECRKDAEALFGVKPITVPVGVISVRPETPEKAPETPSEKDEETVTEAPETAENVPAEAETTAVETVPAEEAETIPSEEQPAETKITMIEARARMNDLRQKKGAAAVRAVLDGLGYKKFTDVPEADYPKLMVCCEAMENSDA